MYDQIFFAHIPKTAGTSLYTSARKHFHDQDMLYGVHALELLKTPTETLISKRYIHGHFSLCMSERLGEKCFRFMFFREPVERVLSLYNFWRGAYFEYPHLYGEGTAPYRVANQSFDEFLANEENLVDIANAQARYLCGDHSNLRTDFDEVAMRDCLGRLNFAGLCDQFPKSVDILNQMLGFEAFSPTEKSNVTNAVSEFTPLSKGELTNSQMSRLRSIVDLDYKVYELAQQRFELSDSCGPRC